MFIPLLFRVFNVWNTEVMIQPAWPFTTTPCMFINAREGYLILKSLLLQKISAVI
jgi:hypothetical protein